MQVKVFNTSGFEFEKPRTGDIGYDLFSAEEEVNIEPWKTAKIGTGIHIEIIQSENENPVFAKIEEKSSRGEHFRIGGGIIDMSYRGEIIVILQNMTDKPMTIGKGAKIAQLIFYSAIAPNPVIVQSLDQLSSTLRNKEGWGSTGSYAKKLEG